MTTDRHPDCEWVLERLDAFVDNELGEAGHAAVTAHCAGCGPCTRELEMAIRVRKMLRTLPSFEAPARAVDAAEREIHAGPSNVVTLPSRRRARVKRTAVMAAAVAVLVAGAWLVERQRDAREQQASAAEVRKATAELALAFEYVGRYSDGVVREDVIQKRVLPHIERAISRGESHDSAKPKQPQTGM